MAKSVQRSRTLEETEATHTVAGECSANIHKILLQTDRMSVTRAMVVGPPIAFSGMHLSEACSLPYAPQGQGRQLRVTVIGKWCVDTDSPHHSGLTRLDMH